MIVTRLKGRLGNQMFQYAAGRALAERHRTSVVLDTSWMVQFRRGGGVVRYELEPFELDAPVRPVWEVARVPNPRRVVYALQRVRPSRRKFVHIIEENSRTNAFVPEVLTAPDQTYLLGYWQFEDYFVNQADAIREAFTFPPAGDETRRFAEKIADKEAVSVHIRRGDYTRHELLGFLDAEYYRRAVAAIADAVPNIHLFVISDDPEWCAAELRFPHPTTVVDRSLPEERGWEDMQLISLCRHHVTSNSTFSWWGAWLNPSPSKVVVAPKIWTLGERRVGDPIPASWVRI